MATTVTKTVKSSGGDYSSLSAWEAGEQGDLVTADEIRQAECYSMADTTAVIINGSTTDATRYLRVYTPTAERHAGAWNTGKYYLEVSVNNSGAIYILDDYVRIEGLQVRNTSATGGRGIQVASNTGVYLNDSIIKDGVYGLYLLAGSTVYAWNLIFHGASSRGCYNAGTLSLYSSTITTAGIYGVQNAGTATLKNCYANGSTAAYDGSPTLTTCASSDATGSAGLQNIAYDTSNFTNVTAGSEDLHIPSGSALIDVGTDTSGDAAPMNFTDDIDGVTRTGTWDVGADEFVGGAPPAASLRMMMGIGT